MGKRILAAALAVLLSFSVALAEAYEGVVVSHGMVAVEAPAGILETLNVLPGQTVESGEVLGTLRTDRVYASQDGTVARILAAPGDDIDGTVLELLPVERFQIYCTVEGVTSSPTSTLVHSGETLYIRCTTNGTHRGVGVVTQIDGNAYRVLTIGGDFYVGEVVNLYRNDSFSSESRVGVGTIVSNDAVACESSGKIVAIHVSEGEYVERGELLYEIADGNLEITAPISGIVTDVAAAQGDTLAQNQTFLTIAPREQLCIEIQVSETMAARIFEGDSVKLTLASDTEENEIVGTIVEIAWIAENDSYAAWIALSPESSLRLGQTAIVYLD